MRRKSPWKITNCSTRFHVRRGTGGERHSFGWENNFCKLEILWLWMLRVAHTWPLPSWLLFVRCSEDYLWLNASCPWSPVPDSPGWVHTGTAWSWFSDPGDRLWTPLSLLEPSSQGWTRTSSVVILSLGSFLRRHLIRHFARELRFSGRVNWPRLIFAKSPLCSAPWNGYLAKNNVITLDTKPSDYLTFPPALCRASPPVPTCPPLGLSTECWTSGSRETRRQDSRACRREGRHCSPPTLLRLQETPTWPQSWNRLRG